MLLQIRSTLVLRSISDLQHESRRRLKTQDSRNDFDVSTFDYSTVALVLAYQERTR